MNITDSTFDSPDSLMITQKYSYTGLAQFSFTNSLLNNLVFQKFGNVILLTHNSITPVLIQAVTFSNIYGAGITLEPQDIFTTTNPLSLTISQSTFKDCTPYVSGFIDVYENSVLTIDTSTFTNLFSIGSGSVILGNYKQNLITIRNSTF